jgi:hypothetical protein
VVLRAALLGGCKRPCATKLYNCNMRQLVDVTTTNEFYYVSTLGRECVREHCAGELGHMAIEVNG